MRPTSFRKPRRPSVRGVFKKVDRRYQTVQKKDPIALREREGIDVINPHDEPDCYESLVVPSCGHGRSLLYHFQSF